MADIVPIAGVSKATGVLAPGPIGSGSSCGAGQSEKGNLGGDIGGAGSSNRSDASALGLFGASCSVSRNALLVGAGVLLLSLLIGRRN